MRNLRHDGPVPFLEAASQIPDWGRLELESQTAAEIAVGGHQHELMAVDGDRDNTLLEKVADICLHLDARREDVGKRLANTHAEIGVDSIHGLAVGILLRDGRPVEPLIANHKPGIDAWNLS